MAQYTFSFVRSEYDRIPHAFKKEMEEIIEKSNADPATKKLVEDVCSKMSKAIEDICKYAQDQLKVR
jgi:hypothetical protein